MLTALAAASLLSSAAVATAPASTATTPTLRPALAATTASPHTYYVDSARGSDSAAGTSTATAWKSLAKVNSGTEKSAALGSFNTQSGSYCRPSQPPKKPGCGGPPAPSCVM